MIEPIDFVAAREHPMNAPVMVPRCKCSHSVKEHIIDLVRIKAPVGPCVICDCKKWTLRAFVVTGTISIPSFPLGHVR